MVPPAGEVHQVFAMEIEGGDAITDRFRGFRRRFAYGLPHILKDALDMRREGADVFVDGRERLLACHLIASFRAPLVVSLPVISSWFAATPSHSAAVSHFPAPAEGGSVTRRERRMIHTARSMRVSIGASGPRVCRICAYRTAHGSSRCLTRSSVANESSWSTDARRVATPRSALDSDRTRITHWCAIVGHPPSAPAK